MRQFKLLQGDAKDVLKQFNDNFFHCCVTSPPYWQLRDYFSDNQLGQEITPEEYIEKLTIIFDEVKRVLRDDGILWVVMGDSYNNNSGFSRAKKEWYRKGREGGSADKKVVKHSYIKQKELFGIPWMLAFALQKAGWYLRCDIIYNKSNPMPDGAKDRPTRSHEYIFMFTKSKKYFYDYYSSLEDADKKVDSIQRFGARYQEGTYRQDQKRSFEHYGKRNKRSVWNHSVASFKGKHFAVYSEELIDTCIRVSTSEKGYCPKCKSPWLRILKKNKIVANNKKGYDLKLSKVGWKASCLCNINEVEAGIVLDPFCGTSTTGKVSFRYGLDYVGIDTNKNYLKISKNRLESNDIFVEQLK